MQGENDELSVEELTSNLSSYKENLQQVRELLADEPGNSEYTDLEKELEEAIAITKELLAVAKQNDRSHMSAQHHGKNALSRHKQFDIGTSNHEVFPVGTKVQAVYSDDGEWYDATIEAITANGYEVKYSGWGNKEEVDPANIRPVQDTEVNSLLEAEKEAEATKQAIKRKIAQAASIADFESPSLPAKLRIDPNDPEEVKAAKRKKIHAFKSKARFEKLEAVQNKRQNAWQQFQTAKGKTKKIGFFTGRKRESIFKSPDDPSGKVGVINSGKGLTDFQKREKYLQLKGANINSDDN